MKKIELNEKELACIERSASRTKELDGFRTECTRRCKNGMRF